ncbi:hypothetical protein N431DRAFT_431482 [Stipitochalara longipes BDJ]|nr:hypothetical protein N431DRAFT_431482 [Stipitochalara longipes BDJ]
MLYSPAENPFHSDEDFNSIDDPMEDWLESPEFFAGLDIEALVADAQDTGSELQDTDKEKGDPKVLKLAPHSPRKACGCFHCEEHNRPSRPSEMEHDPSQWCYCFNCRIFREKASNAAFWKAHFDKLDADFEEAKAEEKRRKADLPKSKTLDASKVEDSSKPKKACKLGHWVRRHLACSSSGE